MMDFPVTGCLLAATGLMLVMLLMASVFPEVVDSSPLLSATRYGNGGIIELLAAPVDETKPFGPLLLLAFLFALLGPARPWHRLAARLVAGVALCCALLWLALVSALTGELTWPTAEDSLILFALLAITALSAWWGHGQLVR